MKIIQKILKKRELKNMCKNFLIKSLVEHTHISKNIQKKLYDKIDIAENDGNYSCMLESFALYWNDRDEEFEVSIPYMDLYDLIEKNIEMKYKIIDINYNAKWKNIKFINK